MVKSISFRARLLLFFVLVIVVSLALPTWYSQFSLGRDILRENRRDALHQLRLVADILERDISFETPAGLDAWLTRVGADLNVRLTLVADSGVVLADSRVPFDEIAGLDNHADRPEIRQASESAPGVSTRVSDTLGRKLLYVAVPVRLKEPMGTGTLRLATQYSSILDRRKRLAGNILIGVGLTFLLALPLCYFLSRQLSSSIKQMSRTAEAIGKGDYDSRIRVYPGLEFMPLAKSINRMAESISSQIRLISSQKSQLEAIFDGMREGVMVLDREGRISAVNRALASIFPGIDRRLGSRPLEVLMDAELQRACDRALGKNAASSGTFQSLQIEPSRGAVYDVNIVPQAASHATIGAVAVFHDISTLKRLERVRRDFVANVSHELRTPLTSIKGYAETLIASDKADPGAMDRFLEIILKNANHMSKMVFDLLHLSRLEEDREKISLQAIDATSAVRSAFRECRPLAEDRFIELDTSALPEEGIEVHADHDRLVQVFRNLMENAFRYAPQHGTVEVFAEPGGNEVLFGVSDQGPGIPREDIGRIFERFYRVEKHRNRAPGSTGLGLSICKHIIEKHGGRIWAESPARGQDRGTTFLFTLPRPARHETATLDGHNPSA